MASIFCRYKDGTTKICNTLNYYYTTGNSNTAITVIGDIFTDIKVNGVSIGLTTTYNVSSTDEVEFILSGDVLREMVFTGCDTLKSVIIGNGVTGIGVQAFNGCVNLESIDIPNSMTFLYGSYISQEGSLVIMEGGQFGNCRSLKSVTLPDGLNTLPTAVFEDCSSLKSIIIPNGCEGIGSGAFQSCTSLKTIVIPETVTTVFAGAFENCISLDSIYCKRTEAPSITANYSVNDGIKRNGTLYYPTGSDYSQWLSTNSYYLGYYGWNGVEMNPEDMPEYIPDDPDNPDTPDEPIDPDAPSIDLEYGDITAPQGGMNTTMDIETDNVDDMQVIAPDWVDVIEKDGYYEIIVKPNEDGSDRTGEVIFIGNPNKPNKVQQNLIINQNSDNSEMATSISLYKGTVYFDIMGDSEESTVKVKYTNATTINEPEPLADWISIFAYNTEETTEGANNIKTVYYSVSVEENTGEEREEFIKLSCTDVKGREITNTSLLVRQTGVEEEEPDIIVSAFQKIGKVNYDGSSAGISIDSIACGYKGVSPLTPTVDVDWIHLGEGILQSGYGYDEIYRYPISFDVNEGAERVGVITFVATDEMGDEYTDTCTITQLAKPYEPEKPEKPEDTDNETYSPIWKDVEYVMGGDDVRYGIYTEETYRIGNQWFKEDVLLFSGRAYAAPNEVTVSININKICQNYMNDNPNIFTGSVGYGHSFKTFKLKNEYGTLLHTYHFINDWSYKELTLGLKTNPIVPYIGDGQKLFFSTFATDEKSINWGMRYYNGTPDYDNQERVTNDFGTLVVAPSREKGVKTFYFGANSFNVLPKCQCKYVLYYVNPKGGYDWFTITGRVSRRDRLETYTVTQNYNNTTADFGKKRYLSTINISYQVNTQWLTQEQSNRMWELLESNTVWLHNLEEDKIYPVIITDTEIEHKYKTNSNKMLSYQINLELSHTRERI